MKTRITAISSYLILIGALILILLNLFAERSYAATEYTLVINRGESSETHQISNVFGTELTIAPEQPLLPLKLLSSATGVPISWQQGAYGSAVVWGRREISSVIILNKARIYTYDGTVRSYVTEAPALAADGATYVPVSALPFLGIDYQFDGASRTLTLTVLPSYNTTSPTAVWQQVQPQVDAYLKPTEVRLASATTAFNPRETNRTENLYLAAASLHGVTIKKGQSFSFNATVGERTAARGYKVAIVFSGKEKVPGIGGGICQVSTTLYQSACAAKLRITERHSHSLPVSYATAKNDATVAWGSKDLRFVNTTGSDIYLVCRFQSSRLTIEIMQGTPPAELPPLLRP